MAEYRLGFTAEETQELERVGRRLRPLVRMAIDNPDGVPLRRARLPRALLARQAWEWESRELARWAESESARLLLTSSVERRRFQAWEREVLLTAGMPRRWSNTTARQSAEAWQIMGEVIPPDDLPMFVRTLGLASHSTNDRFLTLRQWWGRLRDAITDDGPNDGQRTVGGFVSGLCNMAVRPTQYDESAASTIASAVISAPTCLRAIRDLAHLGRESARSADPEARSLRSEVLAAWAGCISAVITTWPTDT